LVNQRIWPWSSITVGRCGVGAVLRARSQQRPAL
jgi:hypothetical protein